MKFMYTMLAFLALTFGVSATEFAVVDYQAVIQKSQAFKSFQTQLEKSKVALEGQFKKESDVLKAEEQSLINKRPEYSETEFEKRRAEFEKKVESFKTKFQSKQAEFERNSAETVTKIEEESKKAIAAEAKAGKHEIVYQAAALAYYDQSKDISNAVIKRMDSSLSKVFLKQVK